MALTFIHTSDWHLGFLYRRLGARAPESLEWRFHAVQRIFDVAQREGAHFILVAGDVFHTTTPTCELQHRAAELLRQTPCPLFLIPGNHDPDIPGGVWRDSPFAEMLKGHEQVHLLREPVMQEIHPGVELFPCPLAQRDSTADPTQWIPAATETANFRIGLAHGQWRGYYGEADENALHSIDPQRTALCGLDYLALGDYHSHTPADHAAARARAYYSGTPEVTARDEARSGYALLVHLEKPGAVPQVTPFATGTLQLQHLGEVALQAEHALDELEKRLNSLENPANTLLTGTLRGALSHEEWRAVQQWQNELAGKAAGVDLDCSGLVQQPGAADFEALKPSSAEREIWEMLGQPLTGVTDDYAEIIAAWSEDEAARREARTLFYQLLREMQP